MGLMKSKETPKGSSAGAKLRRLRMQNGLSQEELGQMLGGYSRKHVSGLERGNRNLSNDLACAIEAWSRANGSAILAGEWGRKTSPGLVAGKAPATPSAEATP